MKKKVSLFLAVLISCLGMIGISQAEEFNLHSGVQFGMTVDEVKSAEKANGFDLYVGYLGETCFDYKKGQEIIVDMIVEGAVGNLDQYMVGGSIAGFDGSYIYYDFADGKLASAIYHIGEKSNPDRFTKLTEALQSKYGEPMENNGSLIQIPSKGKTVVEMIVLHRFNDQIKCTIQDIKQWLVPTDGGYVSIYALRFQFGSTSNEVILSYAFISNEDFDAYLQQQDAAVKQKLEDEKRKESELANDI